MNKVMAFVIAVTIAVFAVPVNTAATESKIQDNHDQHHKVAKTSSKSDKSVAVKKKRAASKKRTTVVAKRRGITRKR